MRPQRIEVEEDVAGPVLRVMTEILRPVGAVGDLRIGTEHGAHVGGERFQSGDEGKSIGGGAQRGQPAQFGADQKGIDATGCATEVGAVQDEAPVAFVGRRAGIGRCVADNGEVGRLRRA